jgi:hypothetical protein
MNAPTPGWNPDPTGRHEYRYWDGGTWTDDVSDNGVTSVDPVSGPPPLGDEPTVMIDPTQQYAPQPGQPPGVYGPQPGPQPGAYTPMYSSSGQVPPSRPKSGPSTGLIVGLAAAAVLLIGGLAYFLVSDGDDDETSTDTTSQTTEDTSSDDTSSDDTSSDDTSSDDTSSDDTTGDGETSDALVDALATELENSGMFTREQAECFTEAMLDELGLERLAEIGAAGGDITSLTPDEQSRIFSSISECGLTDMPAVESTG